MSTITKRIVITGGPATGKTAVIEYLQSQGYYCFPEVIRAFTTEESENKNAEALTSNPIVFADDSTAFNKKLLEGRKKQYQDSLLLNKHMIFFDRGIPDVLAYMDFFNQSYGEEFISYGKEARYDIVFILPPWNEIFESDAERYETFKEAEALHNNLIERYTYFKNPPILVPKDTIKNRAHFILEKIKTSF